MAYQAAAQRGRASAALRLRRRGLPRRHPRIGQRGRDRHVPRRRTGPILLRTRQIPSPHRVGTADVARRRSRTLLDRRRRAGVRGDHRADGAGRRRDAHPRRRVRARGAGAVQARRCADDRRRGRDRASGVPERCGRSSMPGVIPDLLTCGKGLSAGYLPISAVLATEEVYDAFLGAPESDRTFFHGHTYTANPLACAAALANLQLMAERRHRRARAARVGERLGALLAPLSQHGRRARRAPVRHDDRHRGGLARLAYRIRGLPAGPPPGRASCARCPTWSC